MLVEDKRRYFATRFKKFYREMGLTPSQIDGFELIKIAGVAGHYGDGEFSVTLDPVPPLSPAEKNARLKALLGDEGFRRMREHESSQSTRIEELATALCFTAHPLSPDQCERIAQIVVRRNRAAKAAVSVAEYWDPILKEAGQILSPPQLAALEGLRAQDIYQRAYAERRRAAIGVER